MALNPRASRSGSANSSGEPGGIFQGKITLVYNDGTVRVFVKYLGINVGPCRIAGKQHDEQFQVNDEVLVGFLDNLKSEMVVIGRLTDRPGAEAATTEPIGHQDKTESTISFVNATRVFTIAPVGDSFTVWCTGTRYVKTSAESITLPATTGLYYIYYSASGVLSYKTTFFTWDQDTPTAYIYYNSATGEAEFFADERHGVTLDWATHEYLHRTRGAALANGLGASGYTLSGLGSSNADIQISIENGTFFDEDLQVDITHSATPTANTWEQRLQSPAYIPIFYRSGSGGAWVLDTATAYPVKYGTNHATYNLASGGTWSTPDIGNGKYGITWIVATNNLNEPVIGILGQTVSDNIGQAEDVSYADMDLDGLPIVEIRPLYKLIYETSVGYSNAVKSRLRGISDIRTNQAVNIGVGAAALSSLTDVSLTSIADNDILAYNGSSWTNTNSINIASLVVDTSTLVVDSINNRVGIGTASPLSPLHIADTSGYGIRIATTTNLGLIGSAGESDALRISGGIPDQVNVGGNIYVYGNTHATRAADVAIQSNGNEIITVDGATLRVGIGTTSPDEALDVRGNIALTGSVIFEGATANIHETTLTVVDPTADRTITLPDTTGTVVTTGDTGSITSTMILDGTIVDTKLATISTAGKVSNSATTATSSNTASAIVARDASGNFTAGTITATLSGSASTLTTTRTIWGQNFNGSANVSGALSGVTTLTASGTVTYSQGSLSSTSGTAITAWTTSATTSNNDYLDLRLIRTSTGSDWTSAAHRIQRLVDVTRMGYIQFSPSQGVEIGYNNTSYLHVHGTNGIIYADLPITSTQSFSATNSGNQNNYVALGTGSIASNATLFGYTAYANLRTTCGYNVGISWISTGAASPNGFTPNAHAVFLAAGGTVSGDIRSNANNATSYNTSSDYRLKKDVVDIDDGISKIRQLKPKRFKFIDDPAETVFDGFLAHEVQDIVPVAVSGAKDAVGENGHPMYQQIDTSWMVALLTAGIKELDAKVSELTQRIQELENP